jgi:hypothetical protein
MESSNLRKLQDLTTETQTNEYNFRANEYNFRAKLYERRRIDYTLRTSYETHGRSSGTKKSKLFMNTRCFASYQAFHSCS